VDFTSHFSKKDLCTLPAPDALVQIKTDVCPSEMHKSVAFEFVRLLFSCLFVILYTNKPPILRKIITIHSIFSAMISS